ncbi:NAD(P)H-binding protein [Corynebacterium oculi]|uniref:Tetracycline repressor protein class A from transposon 1721 n=1 Tax=Corynebacterium oculi TaxID=1544416 RepID=A0A0Q1DYE0_9CORY|nr:Tetracycline repressor protein class A from transposon 1721 [Corynebacterium oculi]
MHLHREALISASLDIVDRYGLADLSMRRLARHLGVTPGALYWHVESKQHLLEMVARHMLAPALGAAPTGDTPLDPVRYARLVRSCLLSHRDGAEIVTAGLSMPDLHREVVAAGRRVLGGDAVTSRTFLAFVLGSATLEQAQRQLREVTGLGADAHPEANAEEFFVLGITAVLSGLKKEKSSPASFRGERMSRIVIMGATGMIGSAVAAEARSRGHEVLGLSRHIPAPEKRVEGVEYHEGEVSDTGALLDAARGADALVVTVPINRATGEADAIVEAHRSLIAAAPDTRVIVVGGAGGLQADENTLLVDTPDFPEEYRAEARAFVRILALYRQAPEALDWTMLAPSPEIAPGPAAASHRLSTDSPAGSFVSTGTFAVALLDEVENPRHRRARFSVADAE